MKQRIAGLALALTLSAALSPAALAASPPSLVVNGTSLGSDAMVCVTQNTTYVSLRALSCALQNDAAIAWESGAAVVYTGELTLQAVPGASYITANGNQLPVPLGVRAAEGRILVPVRTLAAAFGAQVDWNSATGQVTVTSGSALGTPDSYDPDALYWLSRIISAESQGECLTGKIAVGNVVLNRVASEEFPDTIYGVIFDDSWGGQFEPVRNGTVYQTPTEESVQAAKLCLDGAVAVEGCLYFIAPALAQNFWTVENRQYVTTIGAHDFYL